MSRGDVLVAVLVRGHERYLCVYEEGREWDALAFLVRWAANPELSFSWYDAAIMRQKICGELKGKRARLRGEIVQVKDAKGKFKKKGGSNHGAE